MTAVPMLVRGDLFACVHHPLGSAETVAVIVPPLFGEYIHHHRAHFVLAERLAARGIAAVRYDHAGTGDSAGDLCDVSLQRWIQDVIAMTATAREQTGAQRVVLSGARMGAAIAVAAAAAVSRLSGIVLWQPLWRPAEHLDDLVAAHHRELGRYLPVENPQLPPPDGIRDVLGFRIPGRLWEQLRTFVPDPYMLPDDVDVAVLGENHELAEWHPPDGFSRWTRAVVQHPRGWLDPGDGIYDVLVPSVTINTIVEWVSGLS